MYDYENCLILTDVLADHRKEGKYMKRKLIEPLRENIYTIQKLGSYFKRTLDEAYEDMETFEMPYFKYSR